MKTLFILLVVYQIKHFLADFPLQTPYMLGKFKGGLDWVLPLLAHVAVHGAGTYMIACIFGRPEIAFTLAFFDMGIHFAMDRVKASPNLLGRYKAMSANEMTAIVNTTEYIGPAYKGWVNGAVRSNKLFWWALGVDQMVHHLTHYGIIYMIVRGA